MAPEKNRASRRFGNFEWLSGQVGFIHPAVAFDNHTIDWADFVWKHHKRVADANLGKRNILESVSGLAVRSAGHPPSQSIEHGRGLLRRVVFESCATRKHQHHDHAYQVLAKDHCRYDRNTRKQVGPKFTAKNLTPEREDKRCSA